MNETTVQTHIANCISNCLVDPAFLATCNIHTKRVFIPSFSPTQWDQRTTPQKPLGKHLFDFAQPAHDRPPLIIEVKAVKPDGTFTWSNPHQAQILRDMQKMGSEVHICYNRPDEPLLPIKSASDFPSWADQFSVCDASEYNHSCQHEHVPNSAGSLADLLRTWLDPQKSVQFDHQLAFLPFDGDVITAFRNWHNLVGENGPKTLNFIQNQGQILAFDMEDAARLYDYVYETRGYRPSEVAVKKADILDKIARRIAAQIRLNELAEKQIDAQSRGKKPPSGQAR